MAIWRLRPLDAFRYEKGIFHWLAGEFEMHELFVQYIGDILFQLSPPRVQLALVHLLFGCAVAVGAAIIAAPYCNDETGIRWCGTAAFFVYLVGAFLWVRRSGKHR